MSKTKDVNNQSEFTAQLFANILQFGVTGKNFHAKMMDNYFASFQQKMFIFLNFLIGKSKPF